MRVGLFLNRPVFGWGAGTYQFGTRASTSLRTNSTNNADGQRHSDTWTPSKFVRTSVWLLGHVHWAQVAALEARRRQTPRHGLFLGLIPTSSWNHEQLPRHRQGQRPFWGFLAVLVFLTSRPRKTKRIEPSTWRCRRTGSPSKCLQSRHDRRVDSREGLPFVMGQKSKQAVRAKGTSRSFSCSINHRCSNTTDP